MTEWKVTVKVGDAVTMYSQLRSISGCRVLDLRDDHALVQMPRGEEEWVPVSHLSIEDE
jgi:hypothetical protein